MRLEVGEPFGLVAKIGMNNALGGLETPFEEVHTLVFTPLKGCRDIFVHEGSSSLACDNVVPNPLEHFHVSTFCSQPSSSPENTYDVPIDNFELCDGNVDMGNANYMCLICLVGMLSILSPYVTLVGMMPPLIHIA